MKPRLAVVVLAALMTSGSFVAAAEPPTYQDTRPVLHAAELLRHHPGVRLVGSGSRIKVYLRGALHEPLVIVDGMPLMPDPAGSLNELNPRDIVRIRVLTDSAELSFYGARAAHGVILVTTRR
jgi:TonB-dependent SusC/RagA subfamily outer membrane receptor